MKVQVLPSVPFYSSETSSKKAFFRTTLIFIIMTKQNEYQLKFKRRKKEEAIRAFGGKCQICGYDKCMGALDFHHVNSDEKDEEPGRAIIQWKWERVKKELDKCIILCANCHREIHYKHVPSFELVHLRRPWIQKDCPICKKRFDTKLQEQIYCSWTCQRFSQRKASRPTPEELAQLIATTSWVQIGKMFGVSDNAIRKWAKNYELI